MRAQVSFESLMMYGWALIIVVVAVLLLMNMESSATDKLITDSCTATTPFICTQSKIYPTGLVNVEISNSAAADMDLVTLSLTCSDGSAATNISGTGLPLANNERQLVNFTCPAVVDGSAWRGNFTILYQKSGDALSHEVPGSMTLHAEA